MAQSAPEATLLAEAAEVARLLGVDLPSLGLRSVDFLRNVLQRDQSRRADSIVAVRRLASEMSSGRPAQAARARALLIELVRGLRLPYLDRDDDPIEWAPADLPEERRAAAERKAAQMEARYIEAREALRSEARKRRDNARAAARKPRKKSDEVANDHYQWQDDALKVWRKDPDRSAKSIAERLRRDGASCSVRRIRHVISLVRPKR